MLLFVRSQVLPALCLNKFAVLANLGRVLWIIIRSLWRKHQLKNVCMFCNITCVTHTNSVGNEFTTKRTSIAWANKNFDRMQFVGIANVRNASLQFSVLTANDTVLKWDIFLFVNRRKTVKSGHMRGFLVQRSVQGVVFGCQLIFSNEDSPSAVAVRTFYSLLRFCVSNITINRRRQANCPASLLLCLSLDFGLWKKSLFAR